MMHDATSLSHNRNANSRNRICPHQVFVTSRLVILLRARCRIFSCQRKVSKIAPTSAELDRHAVDPRSLSPAVNPAPRRIKNAPPTTGSVGTSRIPLVWGKCAASRMCCRLRRSFTPFELLTMYDRGSSVCELTVEGSQHLVVVFNTMTCWPGNRGERSCLSACRSKYSC